MVNIKRYFFDFITERIPVSQLTIRRNLDTTPFCSVSIPDPEQPVEISPGVFVPLSEFIESNPGGLMTISQTINGGAEVVVGTYNLNQSLPTNSPSAFTLVLNGDNTFGDDQASTVSGLTITNPITSSNNSIGNPMFSAEENALIVIGDIINFSDTNIKPFVTEPITVQTISLFVTTVNSRMDVIYS